MGLINEELKKNGANPQETKKVEVLKETAKPEKQTPEKLFLKELEDLSDPQTVAYEQIKDVRKNVLLLEDYENFTLDSAEDWSNLITHIVNEKIWFEDDGVVVDLRTPLLNSDSVEVATKLKVLYKPNQAKIDNYTRKMTVRADDINTSLKYSNALICASLGEIPHRDRTLPISLGTFRRLNQRDMAIITLCYNFFQ